MERVKTLEPSSSSSSTCPEGSPIRIKVEDCLQELLKFNLQSSINGTLDFDLGLSSAFCSGLLRHDPSTSNPLPDSTAGVPPYPLYKHLTSALWESLCSGTFCPKYKRMSMMNGENSLKQKEEKWLKLILDKGSEMVQILKTLILEFNVDGSFFTQLKGLQFLNSLNREEEEMVDGVLSICISSVPFQPYISLAEIISGLSYEGLQGLLGLTHTTGTVADVLPPPRSALLSSFMLPYKTEA